MALDSAIYLVTREIAMRSGVINSRYRTADGRFILSNKDLALVRLTSEEYVTGLRGVERISEEESQRLIAQNHFQRGTGNVGVVMESPNEEQPQEAQEETTEEPTEETTDTESESGNDNENNEQEQVEEE